MNQAHLRKEDVEPQTFGIIFQKKTPNVFVIIVETTMLIIVSKLVQVLYEIT